MNLREWLDLWVENQACRSAGLIDGQAKVHGDKVLKTFFRINCFFKKRHSMNGILRISFILALALIFSGCKPKTQTSGPKYGESPVSRTSPVYHFAIHPLYNPAKLMESYQPLMDYLNGKLKGAQLILEASRDYANFEQKYKESKPEFLLPNPWRTFQKDHPAEAAELKVIWETESLINNSDMVRNDIPSAIREQVQKYLIGLHETEQGRVILAGMETSRFFLATNKDYDAVQKYIDRFEKEIRKVETKFLY
ncbi:MAG: PhnD/SsuA/transferrin family substrate-binding protein [Bacteroidia bacterium]|nr:PhnD/SsuA/transferrin family substrate-binding protein [Bacteroidia bacterium]